MMYGLKTIAVGAIVPIAAFKLNKNPGAGMKPDEIKPFTDYHKDGYAAVDCVLDEMLLHGDKHGDGAAAYTMGAVSGVSIVHYTEMVAKMDQKPMTHEVCFDFCRTIPKMGFFGINNGRDCYCAPYYKQAASDSSECNAPCDGDSATMCGGKKKSSVFAMHFCDDGAENLAKAADGATKAKEALSEVATKVSDASKAMQSVADVLQAAFGKVGDSAASGQMQDAKIFAGELEHAAEDGTKLEKEIGALPTTGTSVKESEKMTSDLTGAIERAESSADKLRELEKKAVAPEDKGHDALYYPVMYFVDKEFKDVPSTCGGKATAAPMVGSIGSCAEACEAAGSLKCVGFQFYAKDEGLCVLFSKVTSATYYTGCAKAGGKEEGGKFLQTKAPTDTKCVVKLTEFQGQTLKPDGSGKCKACLKEAKKADRCFE